LRPDGTLVNVQPRGGAIVLSLSHWTDRDPVGSAYNMSSFEDGLVLIDAELRRRVDDGQLVRLAEEQFDMEFRFETLKDWREFVERPHAGTLDVEPRHIDTIVSALRDGHGAVLATEAQLGIAFRRLSAAAAADGSLGVVG
jgi:hypothetical protein